MLSISNFTYSIKDGNPLFPQNPKQERTMAISTFLVLSFLVSSSSCSNFPLVINTWGFEGATGAAWEEINREGASALDAVEVRHKRGFPVCQVYYSEFN